MSTQSTTPEASVGTRLSPSDTVPVLRFRSADESAIERLNEDLGLELTPVRLARLQAYFHGILRRDPTVGELRILDRLEREDKLSPRRIAVGELYTDSDDVAETWADMMQKQGALHRVGTAFRGGRPQVSPPCTLDAAASLIGRYLFSTCPQPRSYADRPILLTSVRQELEVATAGYSLLARLQDPAHPHAPLSVWTRPQDLPLRPSAREGDILLYLTRVPQERMLTLLEADRTAAAPLIGDVRALTDRSLLLTLPELAAASEIYADRLDAVAPARRVAEGESERSPKRVYISIEALCSPPAVTEDGVTDYLLRAPQKNALELAELLRSLRIPAILCGRVRHGDRTVVRAQNPLGHRRLTVMNIHTRYLQAEAPIYLRRFSAEESGVTPPTPAFLDLGSAATALAPFVYRVPDACLTLSAASVSLPPTSGGYAAAMHAVANVADALIEAGVSPARITLAVSLAAASPEMLTEGVTLEVICGLYRAAAERGLPIVSPVIAVVESVGSPLSLTVAAWTTEDTPA